MLAYKLLCWSIQKMQHNDQPKNVSFFSLDARKFVHFYSLMSNVHWIKVKGKVHEKRFFFAVLHFQWDATVQILKNPGCFWTSLHVSGHSLNENKTEDKRTYSQIKCNWNRLLKGLWSKAQRISNGRNCKTKLSETKYKTQGIQSFQTVNLAFATFNIIPPPKKKAMPTSRITLEDSRTLCSRLSSSPTHNFYLALHISSAPNTNS